MQACGATLVAFCPVLLEYMRRASAAGITHSVLFANFHQDYAAVRAYNLPVLYDIENELATVDWLAIHYPGVNFIIPHLGSFGESWRAQTALLERLESYPNIHVDSAGVRFFDLLERLIERGGARKLLFGSDGPWLHPAVELAKIRLLKLPHAQEQLILAGNFLNLIGMERPGVAAC
jgi:uncharacterized protein